MSAATAVAEAPKAPSKALFGWTTFAFMTVACTGSIAQLSASAEFGLGAVTLYLLPALLFLLPVALIASELATGWRGGVFVWVHEGIGPRAGFQAIWLQWIQSVALYPSLLSFAAASLAFALGDRNLATNGYYTASVILVVFWSATFVAMRGMGSTSKLSSRGMIIGTLIPALALVVLMIAWLAKGEPSNTPLEVADVVPPFDGIASIVLIISNFIAFAGLEVNSVHVRHLKDPGRSVPRALAVAGVIIVVMYMLGSISISVAVPQSAIDLNAGAAQAFTVYGDGLGIAWLGRVMAGLLVIGVLAAAVSWIAGPSRGLLLVGRRGYLPPRLQRTNAAGIQRPILLVQGVIVTILAMLFVFIPSVSAAFWILQSMTVILYLTMYIILFIASVRLRRRRPDVPRAFRAPAIRLVATVGALCALAAIGIAFVPPAQFGDAPPLAYAGLLLAGVLLLGVWPQLIYRIRKPGWDRRPPGTADDDLDADDVGATTGGTP